MKGSGFDRLYLFGPPFYCILLSPRHWSSLIPFSGAAGASVWNRVMRVQGLSMATGQSGPPGLHALEAVKVALPIERGTATAQGRERHSNGLEQASIAKTVCVGERQWAQKQHITFLEKVKVLLNAAKHKPTGWFIFATWADLLKPYQFSSFLTYYYNIAEDLGQTQPAVPLMVWLRAKIILRNVIKIVKITHTGLSVICSLSPQLISHSWLFALSVSKGPLLQMLGPPFYHVMLRSWQAVG